MTTFQVLLSKYWESMRNASIAYSKYGRDDYRTRNAFAKHHADASKLKTAILSRRVK